MSLYDIPQGVLHELTKIIRKFWWQSGTKDGMPWISWDVIYTLKRQGGLGFKDLELFNLSLLAKQEWRILQNPNSLVVRA